MNFTHIERKKYKHTFLKRVELVIEYTHIVDFKDKKSVLMTSLDEKGFWQEGVDGSLRFISSDQYFKLLISDVRFVILTDCKGYRGFETMLNLFDRCSRLLDILCEGSFQSLQLRKVNILPCGKTQKDQSAVGVLNELFSDDLRRTHFGENVFERELLSYYMDCAFRHEGGMVSLKYGFDTARQNDELIFVVLDMVYTWGKPYKALEAHNLLNRSNNILFDVFHWAVSQKMIELMQ